MLKRLSIILIFLVPTFVKGQENSVLDLLAATSHARSSQQTKARINAFIQDLRTSRPVSEFAFLKKIFHKTHREFLRAYVPYSEFGSIVETGSYDCLTATALYATVLDELGFHFRIIETNYHIFLLVKTSRGECLLETTDRFNGLVRNRDEIAQRIGTYRLASRGDDARYRYHCDLYNEVSLSKLPGLLYFNQAVKAYNAGDLETCGVFLSVARSINDNPRIAEFATIFLKTVLESQMDQSSKLRIIRQFKGINPVKSAVLALR